jgi:O-antigen ligase
VFNTRTADVFYLPKLIALWALLTTVSFLLVLSILTNEPRPRLRWIGVVDAPVATFVVLILVALAASTDRHQSLFGEALQHQGVLTTLLYVGFFYVARSLVRDLVRLRLLLAATAIGATVVAAYAIVQRLGLDPIWKGQLPSGRVFSTIGQANALAAYLVLAIPITAALARTAGRVLRFAALVAVGAMIGALVLTYSRGGYVGLLLAAAVLTYGEMDRIRLPWGTARAYVGGALVAVALAFALVAPLRSTVAGAWDSASHDSALDHGESFDRHLDLWRVAVEIVEDHPLVGTGPETFPDQFARYGPAVVPAATMSYFEQFRVESPHNNVLALAAGAGIPAVIAYVAVLIGLARTLWRRARRETDPAMRAAIMGIVAAGAGHVVTDSFMSAEVTGSWLFWTLTGGGIGIAALGAATTEAIAPHPSHASEVRSRND